MFDLPSIYPTLRKRRLCAAFLFSALFIPLVIPLAAIGQASPAPELTPREFFPPDTLVHQYVDAYNRGDVEAMAQLMHPDIEWLSISGSSAAVLASGKEALIADLRAHLKGAPAGNRSELGRIIVTGNTASVVETAHWISKSGEARSQSSMAVYETIGDRMIRRIWYFPANK
ncbi:MAG: nuclear transport factor 2 family protein [Pseudomonadota bacterium]